MVMAKQPMSQAHKDALAEGRRQGRVVKRYLEMLEPAKRGRKRTVASVERDLQAAEAKLEQPMAAVDRLKVLQDVKDLRRERISKQMKQDGPTLRDAEKDFIPVAKAYSDRVGIEYSTWRQMGVPAAVLKKAKVSRAG